MLLLHAPEIDDRAGGATQSWFLGYAIVQHHCTISLPSTQPLGARSTEIFTMTVYFPFRCQIRNIARWLSVTLETPGETQARVLYQVRRGGDSIIDDVDRHTDATTAVT